MTLNILTILTYSPLSIQFWRLVKLLNTYYRFSSTTWQELWHKCMGWLIHCTLWSFRDCITFSPQRMTRPMQWIGFFHCLLRKQYPLHCSCWTCLIWSSIERFCAKCFWRSSNPGFLNQRKSDYGYCWHPCSCFKKWVKLCDHISWSSWESLSSLLRAFWWMRALICWRSFSKIFRSTVMMSWFFAMHGKLWPYNRL